MATPSNIKGGPVIENHEFEALNGATITLDSSTVKGQRFSDGNQNVQICTKTLGGGTYSVYYRFPSGENWIGHVENATENDSVTIVGKDAPLFEALQVRFTNTPVGTNPAIYLTTWVRGI